jgi:hypothetical protein
MQAKVPGMDLTRTSGQAGADGNMTLRGNRSISANNSPLILVDGVEYGSTVTSRQRHREHRVLKDASQRHLRQRVQRCDHHPTARAAQANTRVNFNAYLSFNTPPRWFRVCRAHARCSAFDAPTTRPTCLGQMGQQQPHGRRPDIRMSSKMAQPARHHPRRQLTKYDTFCRTPHADYEASVRCVTRSLVRRSLAAMYRQGDAQER